MAGAFEAGHVFARLDARLDDRNFRRFDKHVDQSRAKARELGRDQDRLGRSTRGLTRDQEAQIRSLREQGDGWGAVARKLGLSGKALRGYRDELGRTDSALRGHSKTIRDTVRDQDRYRRSTRETTREQERSRRSTRDSERSFLGLDGMMARLNRTSTFFSKTLRLLKWPALIAGAGAALQGVNALTGGVVALVSALSPLSGLLITIPAGLGTFAQALSVGLLAVMGVKDAVKSLNDQELKAGATAEDTAKRRRSAAAQVRSASEQLADAERGEESAVRDLSEARKDAVDTLVDMRNAAVDARFGEEGAQLSLRRAISDLRKAEADPKTSMLDLEELELRVRESRQQLKEARIDSKRAREEDRKAQRGGVRGDPGVVEARRQLADAEREVQRSARGVSEAERDAQESLGETSTAARKVEESFASLSPEAQKFSRFLFSLKPQLQGIQEVSAKGFLPGAEKGITSALRNLPVVNRVVGATSKVLGNLSERAGDLFGSKGFGRDFERIGKGNARTLGLLGRGGEHLTKALTKVLVVAQPFLRWTGKYLNHLSAWVERTVEVNRKNGDMARFFGRTRQVVERLTSIIGSLGGFLHVVGEEAAPLGRQILEAFDEGAEGLERWSESTKGRNSIAQYFEDARGPLWEAGRLVRDIVKAFFELGDGEGMESIQHLLRQVRVELLPVFTEMTKESTASFGPHLIEFLTAALGLFGRLAGSSGPLTLYLDSLTAGAKATNFLLDAVPGLRSLTTNFIALAAVVRTIKWAGAFTGLEKAFEWALGTKLGNKLKTRVTTVVKTALARGAFAANYAAEWGMEIGARAAGGISKQIGRFKTVARKAAIAFIGTFAPHVAAEMAAGGRLGEALSARFPRLTKFFGKWGGKAGAAFAVAAITFGILELLSDKQKADVINAGATIGEWFVNALIDVVEAGYEVLRAGFNNTVGRIPGVKNLPEWNPGVSWTDWNDPPIGPRAREEARERTPRKQRKRERRRSNRESNELTTQEKRENYEDLWGEPPPPGPGPWPPPDSVRKRLRKRHRNQPTSREFGGGGGSQTLALSSDDEPRRRRRGGKRPEEEARETNKKVSDENRKMRRNVEDESERMRRGVLDRFSKIRRGGSDESKRLSKFVSDSVSDMRGAHDRGTRSMLTNTDARFAGMRQIVGERSGRMAEDLSANVGNMNAVTSTGMAQIQEAVNKALKAFGVKEIDLGVKPTGKKGKPRKAAGGGIFTVPGEGMQDTVYLPGVHAMVAPGEDLFVANRHQQPLLDYAVESTFGVGGLDGFFAAFNRPHYLARGGRAGNRYAGGGMVDVPSDPDHATDPNDSVAASIVGAVNSWVKRYRANITAAFDPGGGHVSPGHNVTGTATDVVPAGGWTSSATRLFEQGLHYLVGKGFEVLYDGRVGTIAYPNHGRGNHAHIEWVGNGTVPDAIAHLGGMAGLQRIRAPEVRGTPGTERTLAQAALDIAATAGNRFLQRKTGMGRREGAEHGVGVPTGPIKRMAREMVLKIWGPGEWSAFQALEMAEAGWNPYATNPSSGAYGLPQALPPSKLPPGGRPGSKLPKLEHAKIQLQWMMKYIQERYGSPSAAWSFHQSNNWYARGGRALRRLARGGSFKGNINHRYRPHWAPDYGGQTLPSYVVAALAEAAGAPGRTMEQVTRGESGAHRKNTARPGSAGVDPGGTKGYGMWAITWPYANSIVRKYGGYPEMWNPVKNAAAMKEVLASNGLGAWYGDSHVTGSNLHYTGKYDIRNALGGMSFKEALAGRKTPGKESIQAERRQESGPKGKKKPRGRAGLQSRARFASPPKGKYSVKALLRTVAETGIGLPYALLMNGVPNWRGLSAKRYNELVDGYYEKVAEYRKTLGEERQQAEESWKSNPLLSGVTSLAQSTIATARAWHSPISGDISAYGLGFGALASLDTQAEANRAAYLNTFTEGFLRPYREKETLSEYIHEGTLKSINPGAEKKAFAEAKLKGLDKRLKRAREGKRAKGTAQAAIANAEIVKGRKRRRRRGSRRMARGGRIGGFLARFAKGGKGKAGVGPGRNAALPTTPAGKRKKVQAQIKRHNRTVERRAERRRQRADERYEEEGEGVLDPVEREREELEEKEQYETARREELSSLLNEVATNVQRTALVAGAQSKLFSPPQLAPAGAVPPGVVPPATIIGGGTTPKVSVPLAVHLSGPLAALNPHIQAVVNGRIKDLGFAAGTARTTVSAPGRRVSYGGS